jgi:beta-glucanase (GH16 family)
VHVRFLSRAVAWTAVLVIVGGMMSAAAAPPKRPSGQGCSAWQDDFSSGKLAPDRWVVASGQAPGYIAGNHIGYYQPDHVTIENGYLKILLTQEGSASKGYISRGGLVYTKATCGYGAYEWTMRMSSTAASSDASGAGVSGSVSAGFLYVNNSETEIDFEYSAATLEDVWAVNWLNTHPRRTPTSAMETATRVSESDATATFHTYRFIWAPGVISFYIDDGLVATHTTDVPSTPAYFMINHWGTNSSGWGGWATPGTSRYFYVKSVSYTPPQ